MAKISENTHFNTDLKTLFMIIGAIAIAVWTYSQINNRIIQLETSKELMSNDLEKNTEFRIKYPRGELGQSSGEAELFMLVEHMAGQLEKIDKNMSNMMHNEVNIERLQKDVSKLQSDVEKLKDGVRKFANGNGNH